MADAAHAHHDDGTIIRGIDWRNTFPFTQLFRSFRIAIHPSKLVLALLALLSIYCGGRFLDAIWRAVPQHRAVPDEMRLFEQSFREPDPRRAFDDHRADVRAAIDRQYQAQLASLKTDAKPNPGMADLEDRIMRDRAAAVANANADFEKSARDDAAARRRDQRITNAYENANVEWNQAHLVDGRGLFESFFDYQTSQINALVGAVRDGNWLGPRGVVAALVNFFVVAPLWAAKHAVYFLIFGLWFLTVWSIFGGAIARIAAVHVARDEKISIRQALAFSISKFLSFFSAPLIPLLIVLAVGLLVAVGGLIGNIPYLGPIVIGALFFLALAAGFVMTLVVIGLMGGFNLMYPTIAVEGSDSFDAISRSFSYLYARPWRMLFYTAVALLYGSLCYLFVRFFIYLILWLAHFFVGLLFGYRADNLQPLWNVMWPNPYSNGRLAYHIDSLSLNWAQDLGAFLLAIWIYLTIAMLGAFAISFYFSANSIIYYLMRREVDATEMDDVYLEQGDEEFPPDAAAPPAAGAPAALPPAGPSAPASQDEPETVTTQSSPDQPPPAQ